MIRSQSDDVGHECPNRLLSFLSSTCFWFPLAAHAVYRVVLGPSKAFHVPSLVFELAQVYHILRERARGFLKKVEKSLSRWAGPFAGPFAGLKCFWKRFASAKLLRAVGARTGAGGDGTPPLPHLAGKVSMSHVSHSSQRLASLRSRVSALPHHPFHARRARGTGLCHLDILACLLHTMRQPMTKYDNT